VTYTADEYINNYREKILYIKYKGKILDLTTEFTIENNRQLKYILTKILLLWKDFFLQRLNQKLKI